MGKYRRRQGRGRARRLVGALFAWGVVAIVCIAVTGVWSTHGADLGAIWQAFRASVGQGTPENSGDGSDDGLAQSEVTTMLRALTVRGNDEAGNIPDYDREVFGQRWADTDRNGCDTRNDILARDLSRPTFKEGTNNCVVLSGTLAEPYQGRIVEFQRGDGTSDLVQIDHVVALADAWYSGAWQWDSATRERFANDPANLLAVDGQTNQDKGRASADQWLPPNRSFRCDYVTTQIRVKYAWGLSVTQAEYKTLVNVLQGCQTESS
nr:HNH endonuclease family protein [Schaalia suimastitidis]